MITGKQLEANKKNSKLGGVKTTQGKAVSKFNSIKHGILLNFATVEECKNADLIFDALCEDFKPKSTMENILISRIACWTVRLMRALRAEQNYLSLEDYNQNPSKTGELRTFKIPLLFYKNMEELEKVYLRYESQIERNIIRSLHELQRIQAIRKGSKLAIPMAVDLIGDLNNERA